MKKPVTPSRIQLPPSTVDPRLNKAAGEVLFPAKLARARQLLATAGLPPVRPQEAPAMDTTPGAGQVRPAAMPANARPKKAA